MDIKITKPYADISPKTFIRCLYNVPHFKILKLIKSNQILLNQNPITKESKLTENDCMTIPDEFEALKKEILIAEPQDLAIPTIFENEDFFVLNKPKNVPVNQESDLTNHLVFLSKQQGSDWIYKPCHRLDKDTKGLLLCAKNQKALGDLQQKFQHREITKIYEAICIGTPNPKSATLTFNLGRENNKTIVTPNGKQTITKYEVEETYTEKEIELTQVTITLITGFTHQIRAHFAEIGHPLLGDEMYGENETNTKLKIYTHALTATKIAFEYKNKTHSITL
jgi:RluA family pseudouridine synthase